jgi:hypothetical protein
MSASSYRALEARFMPKREIRVESRAVTANQLWAMLKLIGWGATSSILAFLLWQITSTEPFWPRMACGLMLIGISLLAGIRIGAGSAAAYIMDVHRLNRVLSEQNRDLRDANHHLLKQFASERPASSEIG